jgi:MEDS: MEthanogen/methylotroph, DcmR Sensory domain
VGAVTDRAHGTRFEVLRTRPHDHLAWVFSGPGEFATLATSYLAAGATLGERVMYVAEDPSRSDLAELSGIVSPDALRVATIAEIYGSSGFVDPASQRAIYAKAVADALAAGFTGLRVAADNTPLVADEERLRAWVRWEFVADRFVAENQITAMCAFNQEKVNVDKLRHLATLHPLSSAKSPVPQFRLFSDGGNLCIEGELDTFAVTQFWLALDNLPANTGIVIDLAMVTMMSRAVMTDLSELCRAGVSITIRGSREAIENLRAAPCSGGELVLQEV